MRYKQFVVANLLCVLLLLPSTTSVEVAGQGNAPSVGAKTSASVEQDFAEALTIIEDKYVDGAKLDYNTAFKSSIIGMLRALDPHSNYYDRQEFEELRTDQRSEYYGIGASIGARQVGGNTDTYVIAPTENSPAARAGLRFGDRIVEISGEAMRGKTFAEVRSRLRGPRGSVIKVKVERAATKNIETVDVARDVVPQPSIPSVYALSSGVGYIGLTDGFNTTTADELEVALANLQARNVRSLVLDLRDNPGGFVDQAVRVASKFLQRGQLVLTQKGRAQRGDRLYRSEEIAPVLLPLVVLVNGSSASASEIVAGALQDHDRALIVGENSFGKGLVQSIIPLEYGAGLTLTSAKYYTPSGRLIQRDYSNENLYEYYTRGNSKGANGGAGANQTRTESRTDTGRIVYGGGGIMPDEAAKPFLYSAAQLRLIDPTFAFVRELLSGRIAGFENYRAVEKLDYNHILLPTDFPVTDALYAGFKSYVANQNSYKLTSAQIDHNRDLVARQLRYNMLTATYGTTIAGQVFIADDPQVVKAIEVMPRARELALQAAMRLRRGRPS